MHLHLQRKKIVLAECHLLRLAFTDDLSFPKDLAELKEEAGVKKFSHIAEV